MPNPLPPKPQLVVPHPEIYEKVKDLGTYNAKAKRIIILLIAIFFVLLIATIIVGVTGSDITIMLISVSGFFVIMIVSAVLTALTRGKVERNVKAVREHEQKVKEWEHQCRLIESSKE